MESNTTNAVVVWDATVEQQVKNFIASGASVPKGLMKLAPKGYVAGLRTEPQGGAES
jgi:hypothetical protein